MPSEQFKVKSYPNVSSLDPAYNGEGLLLEGYAATWSLDRVGERFNPYALDVGLKKYMATNPVVLFAHKKSLPAIGRVLDARVDRSKGLFVKAVLPRPAPENTFTNEIYDSVQKGNMKAFSVSGFFGKKDRGSYKEIVDADIVEISVCPVGVNMDTYATKIVPTEAKCLGDEWVPVEQLELRKAAARLAAVELDLIFAELAIRY